MSKFQHINIHKNFLPGIHPEQDERFIWAKQFAAQICDHQETNPF